MAIAHFGKKQHLAEQPAVEQLPSPIDHAFMPPHELLAQTLPEYDADVARIGFRPVWTWIVHALVPLCAGLCAHD